MLRKLVPILAVLLLFAAIPAKPQTVTQQAVLSWTAASDAVASSTYNVYRASGACPASGLGTLTFTKLNATGISALTYTDSTLTVRTWCFLCHTITERCRITTVEYGWR